MIYFMMMFSSLYWRFMRSLYCLIKYEDHVLPHGDSNLLIKLYFGDILVMFTQTIYPYAGESCWLYLLRSICSKTHT